MEHRRHGCVVPQGSYLPQAPILRTSPHSASDDRRPLPIAADREFDKLTVLSVANIFASAIRAVFEDTSVSEIFHGANQV